MRTPSSLVTRHTAFRDFWLPVWTLTLRELVRFLRQRTRVVGALGQPIIFWILFGAGLRGSFILIGAVSALLLGLAVLILYVGNAQRV